MFGKHPSGAPYSVVDCEVNAKELTAHDRCLYTETRMIDGHVLIHSQNL